MPWVPVDDQEDATPDISYAPGGSWQPVRETWLDKLKSGARKVFLEGLPGSAELGGALAEGYGKIPALGRRALESIPGSPFNIARMGAEIGARMDQPATGTLDRPAPSEEAILAGTKAGIEAAPQQISIGDIASLGMGYGASKTAGLTAKALSALARGTDIAGGVTGVEAGAEQFREGHPLMGAAQIAAGLVGAGGSLIPSGHTKAPLMEELRAGAGRRATREAYKAALVEKGFKPEELAGRTANELGEMLRQHGVEPKQINFEPPTGQAGRADETLFDQRFNEELNRDVPNEHEIDLSELDAAKEEGAQLRAAREQLESAKSQGERTQLLEQQRRAQDRKLLEAAKREGELARLRGEEPPPELAPVPVKKATTKAARLAESQKTIDALGELGQPGREAEAPTVFDETMNEAVNADVPPSDYEPASLRSRLFKALGIEGPRAVSSPTHMFAQEILNELSGNTGGLPSPGKVSRTYIEGRAPEGAGVMADIAYRQEAPGMRLSPEDIATEMQNFRPRTPEEYVHSLVQVMAHELGHPAPGASPHKMGTGHSELPRSGVELPEVPVGEHMPGAVTPEEATGFASEHALRTASDVIKRRLYELPIVNRMLETASQPGSLVNRAFNELMHENPSGRLPESLSPVERLQSGERMPAEVKGPPGGNPELEKPLQDKLRALFQAQREGRIQMNQRNTVLHAQQAEVIRKYDELVKSGKMPAEQARIETMKEMGDLGGTKELTPGSAELAFTPEDVEAVQQHIRTREGQADRFEPMRAADAMDKALKGQQLQENELQLMRKYFGRPVVMGDLHWFEKFMNRLGRLTGSSRAMVTSLDVSAPGRQGLLLSVPHPVIASRAFGAQLKAMFSEKAFRQMEHAIFTNPLRSIQEASGLHLSAPGGGRRFIEAVQQGPGMVEEMFVPSYAEKLPHVRASERAYITYLNKLRSDVFNKMAYEYMRNGMPFDTHSAVYKDLARAINNLSGRGTAELAHISAESPIGKAIGLREDFTPGRTIGEAAIPLLNSGLFAPRYMFSRLAILRDLPLLYSNYAAPVRKMMLKNVAMTVGAGMSALALAKAMGADVELDPRSSDFAKVKMGNTRLDPWAGFQPWVRFLTQLGTGERKSLKSGAIVPLGKGFGQPTRLDLAFQFLTQKASPGGSLAADLLRGKTGAGRPLDFSTFSSEYPYLPPDVASRLYPMVVQDMADAWQEASAEQLAITLPASLLGVGVQTFNPKTRQPSKRVEP